MLLGGGLTFKVRTQTGGSSRKRMFAYKVGWGGGVTVSKNTAYVLCGLPRMQFKHAECESGMHTLIKCLNFLIFWM